MMIIIVEGGVDLASQRYVVRLLFKRLCVWASSQTPWLPVGIGVQAEKGMWMIAGPVDQVVQMLPRVLIPFIYMGTCGGAMSIQVYGESMTWSDKGWRLEIGEGC